MTQKEAKYIYILNLHFVALEGNWTRSEQHSLARVHIVDT